MLKITGAEEAKKKIPISPPLAVFVDPTDNLYPGNDNLLPFFFLQNWSEKRKECLLSRSRKERGEGVNRDQVNPSPLPFFPMHILKGK